MVGFNAFSQIAVLDPDSARLGNPAGTGVVAIHGTALIKNITEGNSADSVLVRDNNGAVKFVKRSTLFSALGIPFSATDNLPGQNYNGKFLFNTTLQKLRIYDATAGSWRDAIPVDLNNYYTKAEFDALGAAFVSELTSAIALKAADSEVLHKTGDETKNGNLSLASDLYVSGISHLNNRIETSVPGNEQFLPLTNFYAPENTNSGNASQFRFGVAGTTNNAAEWRFVYDGDGSLSNRMDFSFRGIGEPIISYSANKRVGIGTTNPEHLFDVNGTARIKTQLLLGENTISNGNYPIDMTRNGTTNSQGIFMGTQSGNDIALRQNAGTSNFGIYTEQTNADAFTLTQSGNVGIGNLSPQEKLEVSGNIKATGDVNGTSYNKVNITAPATSATLTIANGSSLITSGAFANTLTATAASNNTFPSGSNTLYSTKISSVTSAELSSTLTDETGSGTVVFSASPALTGIPTAPTALSGTNTAQVATTAFVQAAVAGSGGGGTQTLNQVLTAGNTSNQTAIVGRLGVGGSPLNNYAFSSISSGATNWNSFTSSQGMGAIGIDDNSLYLAAETVSDGIKFWVNANAVAMKITNSNAIYLPLLNASQSVQTNAAKELVSVANTGTGNNVMSASPVFTGTPTAPTATAGTNTTQLATTAYVQSALATVNINTQTSNYTLVLADAGKFVQQNVASANNLTVPPNSSVAFPIGTQILLRQMGAGQVTLVAGSGVTLQSAGGALKSRVQFAPITLIKVATNTWAVMGDLTL